MKLQLNEETLNAYINEAIRQELNEDFDKSSALTFKVDFDRFVYPELAKSESENGEYDWSNSEEWLSNLASIFKNTARKAKEGSENQLRKLVTQLDEPKTALQNGTFTCDNCKGLIEHFTEKITPKFHLIPGSEKRQFNKATEEALITTLRGLGYSDKQIGAGLKFGVIQAGYYTGGAFTPLSERAQKKELKKIAKEYGLSNNGKLWGYYVEGTEDDLLPIDMTGDDGNDIEDVQNDGNPSNDVDGQDDVVEPSPTPTQDEDPESQQDDQQQSSGETGTTGQDVFPWDNYELEFPWDTYQARPSQIKRQRTRTVQTRQGQNTTTGQDTGGQEALNNQESLIPVDNTIRAKLDYTGPGQTLDLHNLNRQNSPVTGTTGRMVDIATTSPAQLSQREKNAALRQEKNAGISATRTPDYAGGDRNKQRQDRETIRKVYNGIKNGNNN